MRLVGFVFVACIALSCSGSGKGNGNSQTSSSINFEINLSKEVNNYSNESAQPNVVKNKKYMERKGNKKRVSF